MSRAMQFLRDELDAYADSSARQTTDPADTDELECWIQIALIHLQMIRSQEQRWAASFKSESAECNDARAQEAWALYERWSRACQPVLAEIARLQLAGARTLSGTELRRVYEEIRGLLSVPPDRVIAAMAHLEEGKFRTTAEIRDELRRKVGA